MVKQPRNLLKVLIGNSGFIKHVHRDYFKLEECENYSQNT